MNRRFHRGNVVRTYSTHGLLGFLAKPVHNHEKRKKGKTFRSGVGFGRDAEKRTRSGRQEKT